MSKYWIFDADACAFERCDQQTAIESDVPVIVNDGDDVHVRIDGESRRWPSGELLNVAGVQFDREDFEDAGADLIKALIDDGRN